MSIALVKGSKYWAGASRPFFVSQSMVSSYLSGKGFVNIAWHKRSQPLPSDVDPRADKSYDDDWDEWVSADYEGPNGSLNPPTSIPWLVVHLPSVATQTPVAAPGVPSWVTSSAQAGYAAAQAAAQAAAAAASARRGSAVSSGSVAPANSTPAATPSAPRESQGADAGAAVAAVGVLIVLGTLAAAILRRKRR